VVVTSVVLLLLLLRLDNTEDGCDVVIIDVVDVVLAE